jgi:hypothetical protein
LYKRKLVIKKKYWEKKKHITVWDINVYLLWTWNASDIF